MALRYAALGSLYTVALGASVVAGITWGTIDRMRHDPEFAEYRKKIHEMVDEGKDQPGYEEEKEIATFFVGPKEVSL